MMAMLVESGVVYTAVWIIYAVYNDVGSLDRSAGFFWSNFYMAPLSVRKPHAVISQTKTSDIPTGHVPNSGRRAGHNAPLGVRTYPQSTYRVRPVRGPSQHRRAYHEIIPALGDRGTEFSSTRSVRVEG